MEDDRARWDEKYRGRLGRERKPPDPFVLACLDELGAAREREAVDLASGAGRHALELARRGFRVQAWDVSPIGLGLLEQASTEADLEVETRSVDLLAAGIELAPEFDLVCIVDFLDRQLWSRLHQLLRPGGHVIARTFTLDWPGSKPPTVYRLELGELESGLEGLATVRTEEGGGRAGLLAVRR